METVENEKMLSFADALHGNEVEESTEETAVEPSEETEVENAAEVVESAEGDEKPNAEEQSQKIDPKERDGIYKAYLAEKRKRQELEDRLKNSGITEQEEPNYYDDPNKAIEQAVNKVKTQYDERFIAISEDMAKKAHPDFAEMEQSFREAVAEVPNLLELAYNAPNPGEALYNIGKRYKFHKEYGDTPDDILKNVRSRIYKEVRSEVEKEFQERVKAKKNTPTDISQARAASGQTQEFRMEGWGDILRNKRRK